MMVDALGKPHSIMCMCWAMQSNGMRCPLGYGHGGACHVPIDRAVYDRLCLMIGWTEDTEKPAPIGPATAQQTGNVAASSCDALR